MLFRTFAASGLSTQPRTCPCQSSTCTSCTTGWPPSGGATTSAVQRWPPTSSLDEPRCRSSTKKTWPRRSRMVLARSTTGWPRRRWPKDVALNVRRLGSRYARAISCPRPHLPHLPSNAMRCFFSQKELIDSFCSFSLRLRPRGLIFLCVTFWVSSQCLYNGPISPSSSQHHFSVVMATIQNFCLTILLSKINFVLFELLTRRVGPFAAIFVSKDWPRFGQNYSCCCFTFSWSTS